MNNDVIHELRSATRFPLHLPVILREGSPATAETADISAAGVLIHCGESYEVGARIEFSIEVPAATMGTDNDVRMDCVGRVVRCEPAGERMAVGAIIDEYNISR